MYMCNKKTKAGNFPFVILLSHMHSDIISQEFHCKFLLLLLHVPNVMPQIKCNVIFANEDDIQLL